MRLFYGPTRLRKSVINPKNFRLETLSPLILKGLGCLDRILHKHRNRHRADSTRNRSDRTSLFKDVLVIDISTKTVAAFLQLDLRPD